ncbi:MAG: hypothetical protein WCN98_08695, partial [Verrucomicrobiaceae bacterium]
MKSIATLSRISLAIIGLCLTSCGFNTTVVSLDYQPMLGQSLPGPRVVEIGRFADFRRLGEFSLGTVHTPIGTPLETINTRVPVAIVVRNAFAHGLSARKMLAPSSSAPYILTGEVLEFECKQLVTPSSFASVRVNLVRAGSGQIVYSRIYQSSRESAAYMPGSGSPVPNLRDMASRALQNVVD